MIELCVVHPGGLSPAVWGRLHLPATVRMTVQNLDDVTAYWEGGRTGEAGDLTVDALADRLARELAAGRLRVLLGWGFGGVVAHALAARLRAHAIVLDALAPGFDAPSDDELRRRFAMYLGARGGVSIEDDPARRRRVLATFTRAARRDHALTAAHVPPARPLTVVKAAHSLAPASPALGWDAFAPAEVLASGGDHYTMLTDPAAVAHLAALVRRWLAPAYAAA